MGKKILLFPLVLFYLLGVSTKEASSDGIPSIPWWKVQSIDTVKYSRDLAKEKAKDASFNQTIELQVSRVAGTGATHIAIGTPYDKEFVPYLLRWVGVARKYGLSVWFRGNMSGWEGWFGYPKISRDEHTQAVKTFILDNGILFQNGDIFSPCTECENGGPGDPRATGDVEGYRRFLTEEYKVVQESFRKVGKNVVSNYPMNGDVAWLIMNQETTKALGGIVVIDHYVKDPEQLSKDVAEISQRSAGKVVLGEFGAPIPGIHGTMTEEEQAEWVRSAFAKLSNVPELVGINYWTSFGGSSELWNSQGKARTVANVVRLYYTPRELTGVVKNEIGRPVPGAVVSSGAREVETDSNGKFSLPYIADDTLTIHITAKDYGSQEKVFKENEQETPIVLVKDRESILFRILKWFFRLISQNSTKVEKEPAS